MEIPSMNVKLSEMRWVREWLHSCNLEIWLMTSQRGAKEEEEKEAKRW